MVSPRPDNDGSSCKEIANSLVENLRLVYLSQVINIQGSNLRFYKMTNDKVIAEISFKLQS